MTRIVLVRHGDVEGISPERFRGRTDVPLTALGLRQADRAAARIAEGWRPAAIYTSPMARCIDTGAAIAKATALAGEALGGLNDLDYGAWRWKTHDEVRAQSPELFARWFAAPHLIRIPEGESLQDLAARTADALRFVVDAHPGRTVVLVGHDSVNRAILLQMLDQPLSAFWKLAQSPCAISELEIDGGRVRIVRVNETGHLEGL